jgi:signal recognition particle GTPase
MEREETEEKESVRKTEKERHEMKYKVGDKVKVRSDLKTSVLYGSLYAIAEMIKKKIVTITYVYDGCYKVVEDDYAWTDEMLEGLVEEELTAEEAIRIQAEMCSVPCRKCPISKEKGAYECRTFRAEHPDKVLEILKQRKKEHEKKPIETERAIMVRVLVGNDCNGKCVHEEEVPSGESWDQAQARVLKEYCENHEGKYISTICGICRVKE